MDTAHRKKLHNERVKYASAFFGAIGIAFLVLGFVRPFVSDAPVNPLWIILGLLTWAVGFWNIGNLRPEDDSG